ncbi:hypothetical protein F7O44_02620 [Phytoactinopolyspora sp. XMNu-373]|uniref:Phospholipase n=2 Tax=Phytoactinopolyspora mesophila TaxID=2650750 RepID=A0A7K3LY74_9ACTN|nr:hypothetical protein [Phytoactinopolyspora mesophila]
MWARIGWILSAVLVSFVLTGAGQVNRTTAGPEDTAAAAAVVAITGLDDGPGVAEAIPEDFADVMGYRPRTVVTPAGSMRVIQPHGDCSSPAGPTAYDFSFACKAHDYGYDLLRYATAKGAELGPWARVAIDDQFGSDLRDHCDAIGGGAGCRTTAGIGESAVKANSWRQGQGNPGAEDPTPYLVSGVMILLAAAGPSVAARVRQARSREATAAAGAGPPPGNRLRHPASRPGTAT